jgi:PAP2 superfamily protein
MLTWQTAAAGALFLLVTGAVSLRVARGRWRTKVAPVVREAGVILALYALWQYAGGLSLGHADDAVQRGRWIWDTERSLKLPSEKWLQHGVVHDSVLIQACNIYYATMHFGMLIAALVWLFLRHRDVYPRLRMTVILTTTMCLLVGMVAVAPPRLIDVGMVDTAVVHGQSVYTVSAIGADQYCAMPSVHVAWAAIVPIAVITASRSKWRWLILLHFFATVYVVVVTANHYWADGVVAVSLLALALLLQWGAPALAGVAQPAKVDDVDTAGDRAERVAQRQRPPWRARPRRRPAGALIRVPAVVSRRLRRSAGSRASRSSDRPTASPPRRRLSPAGRREPPCPRDTATASQTAHPVAGAPVRLRGKDFRRC